MQISRVFKVLTVISLMSHGNFAFSDDSSAAMDGAYLDAPYSNLIHPKVDVKRSLFADRVSRSEVAPLIEAQTPVRNQASRGTCSIFSAIAMLEWALTSAKLAGPDLDLSEEWLEYLAVKDSIDDGSSSTRNFSLIAAYGSPEETTLPYIGETWESLSSSPVAAERCGTASARYLKGCLLAHWDPRLLNMAEEKVAKFFPVFLEAKNRAFELRDKSLGNLSEDYYVSSVSEARGLLDSGRPVTLDIDFYYGAWNHRKATEYGISRDQSQWEAGIVGYPESDTIDEQQSRIHRAGHSIVIVGYDDSVEVTTQIAMTDGSTKTFTRKGVYYFKNSWGTEKFGVKFSVEGKNFPGYGMITQDYAHDYGQFYKFGWKN